MICYSFLNNEQSKNIFQHSLIISTLQNNSGKFYVNFLQGNVTICAQNNRIWINIPWNNFLHRQCPHKRSACMFTTILFIKYDYMKYGMSIFCNMPTIFNIYVLIFWMSTIEIKQFIKKTKAHIYWHGNRTTVHCIVKNDNMQSSMYIIFHFYKSHIC